MGALRYQLVSDIHGNFNRIEWDKEADIVLCAGDVSENIQRGMEFLNTSPNPVIFIPGNHEFYKGNFSERMDEMQELCDKSDVVTFANNQIINIEKDRIVCSTLWSDFVRHPVLYMAAELQMNDYVHIDVKDFFREHSEERYFQIIEEFISNSRGILRGENNSTKAKLIDFFKKNHLKFELPYENINEMLENLPWKERGTKFNSFYSTLLFEESLNFLQQALQTPHDGKTIVMTHHAPSYTALSMSRNTVDLRCFNMEPILKRNLNLNKIGAYANKLEQFSTQFNIDAWVHGHLHERMLYRLGSAAVHCNATGRNTNTEERRGFNTYSFYLDERNKKEALYNLLRHTIYITSKINKVIQYHNEKKTNVFNSDALKALMRENHVLVQTLITVPEADIVSKIHYFLGFNELCAELNISNRDENGEYTNVIQPNTLKEMLSRVIKQNIQLTQDLTEIQENLKKELS